MEIYEFSFSELLLSKSQIKSKQLPVKQTIKVGVAGSGNLEVSIRAVDEGKDTVFHVSTSIKGFKDTWFAVCERFIKDYPIMGLIYTIHDAGASPSVVSLRLRQAIETYQSGYHTGPNYLELGARSRIYSLVDDNSFTEFLLDDDCSSPNLPLLNIQTESDDGVVIGVATLFNKKIAIAAQQKDFLGGAVGEIHGAKLIGLIHYAIKHQLEAIVLLIDSGGVRLQEANIGETEISEIIQVLMDARFAGIKTIGVVCGENGAYGGMSIITGCLDYVLVSQITRIGVSGAEVIQAVSGIEGFDASDRPLVWRVYGGRTRYMQRVVQAYVSNQIVDIQSTIKKAFELLDGVQLLTPERAILKQKQLSSRIKSAKNSVEQGAWLIEHHHDKQHDIFTVDDTDFSKLMPKGDISWP